MGVEKKTGLSFGKIIVIAVVIFGLGFFLFSGLAEALLNNIMERFGAASSGEISLNDKLGITKDSVSSTGDKISQLFGASKLSGASGNETPSAEVLRVQAKSQWEKAYAAGRQSSQALKVDFNIRLMQVVPYEINGWEQPELKGILEVENKGNTKVNLTAAMVCEEPSEICEVAGFGYDCNAGGGSSIIVFDDLKQSAIARKTCNTMVVGWNDSTYNNLNIFSQTPSRVDEKTENNYKISIVPDRNGAVSWCEGILGLHESEPTLHGKFKDYEIWIYGYAQTQFYSRGRIPLTVFDSDYADVLIKSGSLQFTTESAVNTESPVRIGIDIGQVPKLDNQGRFTAFLSFSTPNDGEITKTYQLVLQIPEELYMDISKKWNCIKSGDLGDNNLRWGGEYGLLRNYWVCYYNGTEALAPNTKYDFDLSIQSSTGSRRKTYLIGADLVYDLRKSIGPATVNVDCTVETMERTFNCNATVGCSTMISQSWPSESGISLESKSTIFTEISDYKTYFKTDDWSLNQ